MFFDYPHREWFFFLPQHSDRLCAPPTIHWLPEAISLEVKWSEYKAGYSASFSAEVKCEETHMLSRHDNWAKHTETLLLRLLCTSGQAEGVGQSNIWVTDWITKARFRQGQGQLLHPASQSTGKQLKKLDMELTTQFYRMSMLKVACIELNNVSSLSILWIASCLIRIRNIDHF